MRRVRTGRDTAGLASQSQASRGGSRIGVERPVRARHGRRCKTRLDKSRLGGRGMARRVRESIGTARPGRRGGIGLGVALPCVTRTGGAGAAGSNSVR